MLYMAGSLLYIGEGAWGFPANGRIPHQSEIQPSPWPVTRRQLLEPAAKATRATPRTRSCAREAAVFVWIPSPPTSSTPPWPQSTPKRRTTRAALVLPVRVIEHCSRSLRMTHMPSSSARACRSARADQYTHLTHQEQRARLTGADSVHLRRVRLSSTWNLHFLGNGA